MSNPRFDEMYKELRRVVEPIPRPITRQELLYAVESIENISNFEDRNEARMQLFAVIENGMVGVI